MRSSQEIQHLIIHGLGVEGTAALAWFTGQEVSRITVIDTVDKFEQLPEGVKSNPSITHYTEDSFLLNWRDQADVTLYLRSPGVPPYNPVFTKIRERNIPHTTPTGYWLMELAPENVITITGTKGKSSTASLTAHLLRWAGHHAEELGNIGRTPLDHTISPGTICVVELSSYMMHDLPSGPNFHVVTNIFKEHTNWHGSHENYRHDKLKPFLDDPHTPGLLPEALLHEIAESAAAKTIETFCRVDGKKLIWGDYDLIPEELNDAFKAPSTMLALRTAVATTLAAGLLEASQIHKALSEHLASWPGLGSRQCILPTSDDVLWIDDALATVPEATLSALTRWQDRTIHLLLGGDDRGQDFSGLFETVEQMPDIHVYAFSVTADRLETAARSAGLLDRFEKFENLEEMVSTAKEKAAPGEVILFSPAAPSAPPHANFHERAKIFRSFSSSS